MEPEIPTHIVPVMRGVDLDAGSTWRNKQSKPAMNPLAICPSVKPSPARMWRLYSLMMKCASSFFADDDQLRGFGRALDSGRIREEWRFALGEDVEDMTAALLDIRQRLGIGFLLGFIQDSASAIPQ